MSEEITDEVAEETTEDEGIFLTEKELFTLGANDQYSQLLETKKENKLLQASILGLQSKIKELEIKDLRARKGFLTDEVKGLEIKKLQVRKGTEKFLAEIEERLELVNQDWDYDHETGEIFITESEES